jgi:methionyl-tRNA formyltransferase
MLSVSVLCSDSAHPVNEYLVAWASKVQHEARVAVHRRSGELAQGDFLFLVSCTEIVSRAVREKFRRTLVLHASALPKGRGMSPHIWQILEGANELVVTLLDAEDELDSGAIWHQLPVQLDGTELHDEINRKVFEAELQLMSWALANCHRAKPAPQRGTATYFRKRVPKDSELDPSMPLAGQFDLLRVADPDRYPAYFVIRGCRYRVRIDKM